MLMRTASHGAESAYAAGSPNRFLRHLGEGDGALISRKLDRVTLAPGFPLLSAGWPIDFVYFPENAIVSLTNGFGDRPELEVAVVGYEGLVGWSGLAGCAHSLHSAEIQMKPGTALRIGVDELRTACAASATLLLAIMRFTEVIIDQMAQAIVSQRTDSIERRVCRWILMRHDRLLGDQLLVKHDEIGQNLGVRRASVTDCLHILEGERLIRCYRGRIIVLDRQSLQQIAAGSYGAAEACYRNLIGPFGRCCAAS